MTGVNIIKSATKKFIRRSVNLLKDPILRRWIMRNGLDHLVGKPAYTPHHPPYLNDLPLLKDNYLTKASFQSLPAALPVEALTISLAGAEFTLRPEEVDNVFHLNFEDFETYLSLHRFTWLPLSGKDVDPGWVNRMWQIWKRDFRLPGNNWSWHPYTAAERAINILQFASRLGLPEPADETLEILTAHGCNIARKLEFYGDHYTSNHLANNGRGLYLIGQALNIDDFKIMGLKILINEASRIFQPSGILREGSSHYHMLLAKNYLECWLEAHRRRSPEELQLREIAVRTICASKIFFMPGRFPLIGDISPDCPPSYVESLIPQYERRGGFIESLDNGERAAVSDLIQDAFSGSYGNTIRDGWLRRDFAQWSGIWHASPKGWSQMPGHGHQDCGGFEMHFLDDPLFLDLGRGSYRNPDEDSEGVAARFHNSIELNGFNPFPPNKPYYDDEFRKIVVKTCPIYSVSSDAVSISYTSESNRINRIWTFQPYAFQIEDAVDGERNSSINRYLHTVADVEKYPRHLVINSGKLKYRVTWSGADSVSIRKGRLWRAYGTAEAASTICFSSRKGQPWQGSISVENLER